MAGVNSANAATIAVANVANGQADAAMGRMVHTAAANATSSPTRVTPSVNIRIRNQPLDQSTTLNNKKTSSHSHTSSN